VGSPNVNPGYKLVDNRQYPQIASDYEKTFRVMASLPCDIFLGAHGSYFDLDSKLKRLGKSGQNPFIDPAGYRRYVEDRERAFRRELAIQQQQQGKE
jgi:metallo-beta-lactamase class B